MLAPLAIVAGLVLEPLVVVAGRVPLVVVGLVPVVDLGNLSSVRVPKVHGSACSRVPWSRVCVGWLQVFEVEPVQRSITACLRTAVSKPAQRAKPVVEREEAVDLVVTPGPRERCRFGGVSPSRVG